MKKLKFWQVILLIVLYPVGIAWLFWTLSKKFPKLKVAWLIDTLWSILAVSVLLSIYEGPADIVPIIICAILFVLVPFAIIFLCGLCYREIHGQIPSESASPHSPETQTPSKSKNIAEITIPLSSLKSSKSSHDIDKITRKLQEEQENFWDNPVNKRHFELLELEGQLYSKVHKSGDYHSDDAYYFEAVCTEDISLAEEFVRLHKKYDQTIPRYPCFKQLAIFYEKQGNYHLAITVCEEAIRLGFEEDGTQGGMTGRIEKLEKKQLNSLC